MSVSLRRQVSTHRAPTSVYEEEAMLRLALEISTADASAPSRTYYAPAPSAPPPSAPPSTSHTYSTEASTSSGQQAGSSRGWQHSSVDEDERLARELQAAEEAAARISADERLARELLAAEQHISARSPGTSSLLGGDGRSSRVQHAAEHSATHRARYTSAQLPETSAGPRVSPSASLMSCPMSEDERLAREIYAAEQNAVQARLLEDERLAREIYAAEQSALQAARQTSNSAARETAAAAPSPPASQPAPWRSRATGEVHLWPQEANQLLSGEQHAAVGYPTSADKPRVEETPSTSQHYAEPTSAHIKLPPLPQAAPVPHAQLQQAPAWSDSAHDAHSQRFSDDALPNPPTSEAPSTPHALVPGVWHDPTEDAELARKLQHAENASFKNRLKSVGGAANVCAGCNKPIAPLRSFLLGSGGAVAVGSRRYHPDCAKCAACGGKLRAEVAVGPDGKLYHRACAQEKLAPKCDACRKRIPSQGHSTRYLTRPFWKERYCPAHDSDGTPFCCACLRFRAEGSDDLVHFDDGRHLCLMCLETMLPDTQAAQPLYNDVLAFFAHFSMRHPEKPPMMLVEDSALNEYSAKQRGSAEGPMTHTRGVTLTEHYRTIRVASISRRGLFGLSSKVDNVPLKHSTVVQVQAILVLAGLPRIVTGAILAHEAMHAWFAMNKYIGLPLEVEEGMCQLMAYLWVEHQHTQGTEATLASFVAHQIRTDRSPVYGDGFRAALAAYQEHGLVETLRWLKESHTFPPCASTTQTLGEHLTGAAAPWT